MGQARPTTSTSVIRVEPRVCQALEGSVGLEPLCGFKQRRPGSRRGPGDWLLNVIIALNCFGCLSPRGSSVLVV